MLFTERLDRIIVLACRWNVMSALYAWASNHLEILKPARAVFNGLTFAMFASDYFRKPFVLGDHLAFIFIGESLPWIWVGCAFITVLVKVQTLASFSSGKMSKEDSVKLTEYILNLPFLGYLPMVTYLALDLLITKKLI